MCQSTGSLNVLDKYRVYGFQENAHKFQKKGNNGIIPFVYEGKEETHKYVQHKVSMTVCMGRIANQRKWLP